METQETPEFKCTLPKEFLRGMDPRTRYLCESHDIQRQQNEYIIRCLQEGHARMNNQDERQGAIEEKLRDLEPLRVAVKSRWKIAGSVFTVVAGPIGVLVLFEWFRHKVWP